MSDNAIDIDGATFAFETRSPPVLEDVSLHVRPGERLGVLGPNGGGKTTLLRLMLGQLEPDRGHVRIFGRDPAQARRAGAIGYVPQRSGADLTFPVSVRQVVAMGSSWRVPAWKGIDGAARDRIDDVLGLVGATAFADRPIGAISGGQAQRAMIARALASRPKILLLDEPMVGVDASGQREFARLLDDVHEALSMTIVIVSHDIRAIAAGCDRVACLGRTLHAHTSPKGLTPEVLAEVFSHDVAAVFGDVHVDAHLASSCDDPSHHHGCAHEHGPVDGDQSGDDA